MFIICSQFEILKGEQLHNIYFSLKIIKFVPYHRDGELTGIFLEFFLNLICLLQNFAH